MLNLDTHVLIHALAGSATPKERRLLANDSWSVSGIVLWEMAKLYQLGRIDLDPGDADLLRLLRAVHVWPITLEVARQSVRLDFRSDPADELIAATSVVHAVPLVTRDGRMRKSKIVPLA
jgi:PIN domain nuclease of toxin-antitoxin system